MPDSMIVLDWKMAIMTNLLLYWIQGWRLITTGEIPDALLFVKNIKAINGQSSNSLAFAQ